MQFILAFSLFFIAFSANSELSDNKKLKELIDEHNKMRGTSLILPPSIEPESITVAPITVEPISPVKIETQPLSSDNEPELSSDELQKQANERKVQEEAKQAEEEAKQAEEEAKQAEEKAEVPEKQAQQSEALEKQPGQSQKLQTQAQQSEGKDLKNSQVLQNPEWSPIYGRSSSIRDGIDGLWRVVNYKKFYSKWPDIIGRLEKEWNHYRSLNPRNVEEGKFFNMRTGIRGSLLMSFGGQFSGYSSCNSARVRNELLNGKWGWGQLSPEYAPKFKKHILDDRSFYIKVAEALEEVERLQAEAWAKAIKNK